MDQDKKPEERQNGLVEKTWNIWIFEWWNRNTSMGLGLMQGMTSMYFQQIRDMMDQYQDKDKK